MGSGALISPDGDILTCYHVIQGARTITINTAAGLFGDVIVEDISPERDLAILRVKQVPKELGSLKLARDVPAHLLGTQLYVYGWLEGADRQVLDVRATDDRDLSANALVLPDLPQARSELRIIPLHTAIAPGLSGGPLVSSQGVIGVVMGTVMAHGALSWATPVWALDRSHMQHPRMAPNMISRWPPLATRFGSTVNMRAEISDETMDAERSFVDALDRARTSFEEWRGSVLAYTANGDQVVAALGEIPPGSMGRRSSEIAGDPNLTELNGRISGLFRRAGELESEMDAANGHMLLAATEVEVSLAKLKRDTIAAVNELPEGKRKGDVVNSIMKEFIESQERIQQHAFPQLRVPAVVIRDANSVSAARLRQYIIETQANLKEISSPAFREAVEEYFAAQQSIGMPMQRAIQLSVREGRGFGAE